MKKFKIWWYKLVLPKNIKERIWDAILEGQNQFEQWEDIDTCNLIIKSITGEAVFNNIPKDFFKQRFTMYKRRYSHKAKKRKNV